MCLVWRWLGILHEGREYVAGFGVTNVDHPLTVDGDTLFQIGSTTKTVTGTAAMRLVEMGRLDRNAARKGTSCSCMSLTCRGGRTCGRASASSSTASPASPGSATVRSM